MAMFDEPGGRESPYTGAVTAASLGVPGESQPEGPGALVPELIPELVVAPSLLAAGFLLDAARSVDGAADWLHVDIMDNRFVPNQTIGLAEVAALRAVTSLPFVGKRTKRISLTAGKWTFFSKPGKSVRFTVVA